MRSRHLFVLAALLLLAALPAAAQKKPFTPEKIWSLHRLGDAQVSPDGRTVVFSVMSPDLSKNARPVHIWVVPTSGGAPRQVTREGTRNERPRWSPDGRRIAFLSNRGGSQQIWLMDPDGANARQVTDVPTEAGGVMWSPDGRHFLFTSDVYPDCPDMACNKRRDGEREKDPVKAKIFTGLLYRHWTAFKDGKRSHLFIVPAEGGTPRDLSPGDFDTPPFSLGGPDEYAFSPDSREVAFVSNRDRVEAISTNKDIFVVSVTGGEAKKITSNPAWDATPVYSPDGRFIAYRRMARPGYEADRFVITLYDRQRGEHRDITEKYDRSAESLLWSKDGKEIYTVVEDQGTGPIVAVPVAGGEPRVIVSGGSNSDPVLTPDGKTLIFTRASLQHPNEIFRAPVSGTTAKPDSVTRMNESLLADTEVVAPERFTYAGAGGTTIHAWLMKPPGFNAQRKYPLMFLLHGGPQTAWGDGWSFRWNAQVFAAAGYVLVMANRRGSTGFGQSFTDEINADWGGKAYEDIMRGVAHVEKLPFVDPTRIGASGASYGGYLVNWIAGHTDRFRCLVSHAGVFDLVSMYGATEELWFPEWDFGGPYWKQREVYNRLSPSTYVTNFKTPTLVIHGQLDFRVDVSQGYQMFTALQRQDVPSKMIYFPDEGHWVLKPANSVLWYRQVTGWWDQWLKPAKK